jgi:hypothetical protein
LRSNKAKVELAVLIVERWPLGLLRNRTLPQLRRGQCDDPGAQTLADGVLPQGWAVCRASARER